jgi:iron complex outermembrane receptor protein
MNENQTKSWRLNLCAGLSASFAAGLYAPQGQAQGPAEKNTATEETTLEEVIVSGHPLSAEGLAQPFAVLDGDALRRAQAASLGETLVGLPSVHTSSFGQAVGRPVVRGLSGARIKVLEDRIDVLDVSVSSPDHATTVDPFIAESVEVFMGPSTLVYGSGALGGVVDVHTGRIPHAVPETAAARLEVRGADNANRRTAAGRVDTALGSTWVLHADGFYRDADDYDIPGFAESSRLRELEQSAAEHGEEAHDDHDEGEAHHEEEHHDAEEAYVKGTLPGSKLETYGGALGLSYVGDSGLVGLAVSRYESTYGLPGHSHAHHEHGHEDEHGHDDDHESHDDHEGEHGAEDGTAELELEQTRVDFEWVQRSPFAGIDALNLRIGYNDYEHVEFEPDGATGTTFSSEAWEGRLDLVHGQWREITGTAGLQASFTEFSALGEEAFVDPVDTRNIGAFYVGQTLWGNLEVEGGLRLENVEHEPDNGSRKSFSLYAASLGLIQPLGERWQLRGQLDYSSRAPTAIELFANGAHLATQSYELGDPNLEEERAGNVSVGLDYQSSRFTLAVNAYYTQFDDFIYERATGEQRDELPVLQWEQQDAELYGGDILAEWQALNWQSGALWLHAGADTVRAKLDSGVNKNLPRIPPQRWSVGARSDWGNLSAELRYTRVASQHDTAPLELVTDGYDDLYLSLVYALPVHRGDIEIFVSGSNLTDDEQRLHSSFIKDLAPQPGRTLEAGVRILL